MTKTKRHVPAAGLALLCAATLVVSCTPKEQAAEEKQVPAESQELAVQEPEEEPIVERLPDEPDFNPLERLENVRFVEEGSNVKEAFIDVSRYYELIDINDPEITSLERYEGWFERSEEFSDNRLVTEDGKYSIRFVVQREDPRPYRQQEEEGGHISGYSVYALMDEETGEVLQAYKTMKTPWYGGAEGMAGGYFIVMEQDGPHDGPWFDFRGIIPIPGQEEQQRFVGFIPYKDLYEKEESGNHILSILYSEDIYIQFDSPALFTYSNAPLPIQCRTKEKYPGKNGEPDDYWFKIDISSQEIINRQYGWIYGGNVILQEGIWDELPTYEGKPIRARSVK